MTRITIIGAAGRMGRALVRAACEASGVSVVGAVASQMSTALGQDAGELAGVNAIGVRVTSDLPAVLADADVAIDFSNALATQSNLSACRKARKALVVGTTGFAAELTEEFESAAREIPLLVAPNTSLGVTLLIELVRDAARALPGEFDIEIIEAHHRMKKDAPSGTALALGKVAAESRQGSKIGYAVVRGGDIVGDHTVLFAGMGERLALSHQATDRAIFARGALQAAAWLAPRPAGRYFMRDIVTYKSGS